MFEAIHGTRVSGVAVVSDFERHTVRTRTRPVREQPRAGISGKLPPVGPVDSLR